MRHLLSRQRVDEQKEEIERLEGILEVKVDTEKKHVGMLKLVDLLSDWKIGKTFKLF